VLNNDHEWNRHDPVLSTARGLPVYVNGIKQTVDHYNPDEREEFKMTDRIAMSTYVQGNGSETETYTDTERFENINTMELTELVAKFYDVVKVKGSEFPDEWFSDKL
jgi:hypothetical protein